MNLRQLLWGPEIAVVHEFHKPPYGGGNQFLTALKRQWEKQGLDVAANRIGKNTQFVLFNSYNFDMNRLRKVRKGGRRMVHRVDGPIGVYRGTDYTVDQEIWKVNSDLADATVFQSQYSLSKHIEIGLNFKNPVVIPNAANHEIFHRQGRVTFPFQGERKVKLMASSWSNNPRKGARVYEWLDAHLDFTKFEFTFVGRIQSKFKNVKVIDALPSQALSEVLRQNDIYVTASENDPCSNALIEGLSCGMPAVYLKSGGHPEIVGSGGLGFDRPEEIPSLLNQIVQDYQRFQNSITVLSIEEVAKRYLHVLKGQS